MSDSANHQSTDGDPTRPSLRIVVPSTETAEADATALPSGEASGAHHGHSRRQQQHKVSFVEPGHAPPNAAREGSGTFSSTTRHGGGPPPPDDRSPLAMLMRSFAYPVSDEQALEDSIRITLGHTPEGVPGHAPGSGVHLPPPQQFSAAADSKGTGSSLAVEPSNGAETAPHSPAPMLNNRSGSGLYEMTFPTRNYSGLTQQQQQQLRSGSGNTSPAPAAAGNADVGPTQTTTGSDNPPIFGPVVPPLDSTQENHGLPGGEHLVPVDGGEPYVFRYNIRVQEPPPPALSTADPTLLSIIQYSVMNGGMQGYSFAANEGIQSDGNKGNSQPAGHSPNTETREEKVQHGSKGPEREDGVFSPHEREPFTGSHDGADGNVNEDDGGRGEPLIHFTPTTPREGTPSSTSSSQDPARKAILAAERQQQAPRVSAAASAAAGVAGGASPVSSCLFSAEEMVPVGEKAGKEKKKKKKQRGRKDSHSGRARDTGKQGDSANDDDAATAVAVHEAANANSNASSAVSPSSGGEAGATAPLEFNTQTFLTTGSFHAQPILMDDVQRERIIVDCFNGLSSETRRVELLEAFYVAHMQPYENKDSFTGDNWDDVMRRKKVAKWFAIRFDNSRYCFYVTVFRHEHRVFLFSFLLRCFCFFLFWVLMFCMLPPNYFYPGGLYFDTITTILFAGIAGTIVARLINIPTLIGVIWAGILWNNVPYTGRLTSGITLDIRQFVSFFGLTIGIIRAGLSLNVIRFKQKFKHYITFSILPMAAEMVVHGVCAKAIYKFPNYRWAFAEGFLLSSIAPSVVVPIIIAYQRRGYGVRDGPPMMMLCSIAVDTAICVWGIQFLLALEFKTMSTAVIIVLAPVQVLIGLVGGVILGFLVFMVTFYVLFMEAERLPGVRTDRQMTLRHSVHVRYLSIGFMVLVGFTCFSIGKRFSCVGGSAIGVVTVASTFNYLCVRGGTRDHLRVKADMAQTLTTVWDYIAMPSLFGLSGAAVNVHELFARNFIGQAFALVFIGIGTRSVVAMAVPLMTRLGLSWPEILFCGIGWIGKGSVQGSLGATAQNYAAEELAAATTPAEVARAQERIEFGKKMKNTAVLGILVACPLCSIFLTKFTSKLLRKGT